MRVLRGLQIKDSKTPGKTRYSWDELFSFYSNFTFLRLSYMRFCELINSRKSDCVSCRRNSPKQGLNTMHDMKQFGFLGMEITYWCVGGGGVGEVQRLDKS